MNQEWTDVKLYKRYGLTKEEIAFIESQVAEHDATLFDEAAVDEAEDE
jgi:site-specific DNA-methyltransferase (adenine-specific)